MRVLVLKLQKGTVAPLLRQLRHSFCSAACSAVCSANCVSTYGKGLALYLLVGQAVSSVKSLCNGNIGPSSSSGLNRVSQPSSSVE